MKTLKTIWDFFQNEILGMNWLNRLIATILNVCGLDTTGKIGASIQFFIYDTIKIMVLLGVTFSFLISSPMVDLGSLVLLMSIFGWKVAVLYVILGLVIAVVGGMLIEKLHLDNQVEEYIRNGHSIDVPKEELYFKDRMKFAWEQVVETAKKVAPFNDYASQSRQAKAARYFHWNMHYRYYHCRLFLQRNTIFNHII